MQWNSSIASFNSQFKMIFSASITSFPFELMSQVTTWAPSFANLRKKTTCHWIIEFVHCTSLKASHVDHSDIRVCAVHSSYLITTKGIMITNLRHIRRPMPDPPPVIKTICPPTSWWSQIFRSTITIIIMKTRGDAVLFRPKLFWRCTVDLERILIFFID